VSKWVQKLLLVPEVEVWFRRGLTCKPFTARLASPHIPRCSLSPLDRSEACKAGVWKPKLFDDDDSGFESFLFLVTLSTSMHLSSHIPCPSY
jgi:hypothetical protein